MEFLSWHGGAKNPLLHGEAVAIGMCVSAECAFLMGVCDAQAVEDHYQTCHHVGLPSSTPAEMDLTDVIGKLAYDKHTLAGCPTMGLLVNIGDMYHVEGVYGHSIPTHPPESLRDQPESRRPESRRQETLNFATKDPSKGNQTTHAPHVTAHAIPSTRLFLILNKLKYFSFFQVRFF